MGFYIWASILILSLVEVGICIRILALSEVPVAQSLVVRGVSCLVLVIGYACIYRMSLAPKSIRTQVIRATLAGLALTFLALSYNWLSASSVSVLSNIDVPLLIVLGPVIGSTYSKKVRGLAFASILLLVFYVANLEVHRQLFYGLSTLLVGSLLLCFGYLFIKKSMTDENKAVAIMTPSLAIVLYGIGESVMQPEISSTWNFMMLMVCILSGVGMFVAYVATMKLYEMTDLATAEFPTLMAAVVIQPLEALILGAPLKLVYLLSAIGFVVLTYLILNLQKKAHGVSA